MEGWKILQTIWTELDSLNGKYLIERVHVHREFDHDFHLKITHIFDENQTRIFNQNGIPYDVEIISSIINLNSNNIENIRDMISRFAQSASHAFARFDLSKYNGIYREDLELKLSQLIPGHTFRIIGIPNKHIQYNEKFWIKFSKTKPTVTLLLSDSNSGKSTYARRFSNGSYGTVIHGDKILFEISNGEVYANSQLINICKLGRDSKNWSISILEIFDNNLHLSLFEAISPFRERKDFLFEMYVPREYWAVLYELMSESGYKVVIASTSFLADKNDFISPYKIKLKLTQNELEQATSREKIYIEKQKYYDEMEKNSQSKILSLQMAPLTLAKNFLAFKAMLTLSKIIYPLSRRKSEKFYNSARKKLSFE